MTEYIEREKVVFGILGLTIVDSAVAAYADAVLHRVQSIPAADVAPVRHGHIVTTTDRWATYHQNCSECSEELPWKEHPNFCHNCGAKMDGDSNA